MIPKKALEIVNNTLQDLCSNKIPFGGKLIILGENFRQILPIVKNSTKHIIVEDTIKFSKLWSLFEAMKLKKKIDVQIICHFLLFCSKSEKEKLILL